MFYKYKRHYRIAYINEVLDYSFLTEINHLNNTADVLTSLNLVSVLNVKRTLIRKNVK